MPGAPRAVHGAGEKLLHVQRHRERKVFGRAAGGVAHRALHATGGAAAARRHPTGGRTCCVTLTYIAYVGVCAGYLGMSGWLRVCIGRHPTAKFEGLVRVRDTWVVGIVGWMKCEHGFEVSAVIRWQSSGGSCMATT